MKVITLSVLMLSWAAIAHAHDFTVGDIKIDQPWARATPPVAKTGAAYFKLHNSGTQNEQLLAASTDIAEKVELHKHIHENNMMKMRHIESVEIPAGAEVVFQPGNLHVMLIGLKSPLIEGQSFPLNLRFAKAGQTRVEVKIKSVSAADSSTN